MHHPVVLRPECVAWAGDIVTGVFLSHLVQISTDGWIAKTRQQWAEESGLTLQQCRRALTVLKVKQLVTVKIKRVGGGLCTHIKVNRPVSDLPVLYSVKTPKPSCLCTTEVSDITPVVLNKKEEVRVVELSGSRSTRAGESTKKGEDSGEEEGSTEREEVGEQGEHSTLKSVPAWKTGGYFMKAADVLKAHQASQTGSLGAYWKSRVALVQDGYQKALTGKEQGQLKQLSKYLGDQTKPVIAYAVEHWWKFASRAGAAAGCAFPADPHIGFLLKHHAVAVNLLMLPLAKGDTIVPPPQPVQSIAAGAETEPAYVPSSQELTTLLEGLKSP